MVEEPRFYAPDRASLRSWLVENAARSAGVWLVYDKGRKRSLPYDAVVPFRASGFPYPGIVEQCVDHQVGQRVRVHAARTSRPLESLTHEGVVHL